MNDIQKRFTLFIFGCIIMRIIIIYLTKEYKEILKYVGMIALIISFSFFYIFLTDKRKTGLEVFGKEIWWNYLRPIHGILYLIIAVMALNEDKNTWKILIVDLLIGIIGFINYHYNENNFDKLLQ